MAKATPLGTHPPGYGAFVLPALDDASLALFCEPGRGCALVTVTCILFGPAAEHEAAVRAHWTALADRLFPSTPEAARISEIQ